MPRGLDLSPEVREKSGNRKLRAFHRNEVETVKRVFCYTAVVGCGLAALANSSQLVSESTRLVVILTLAFVFLLAILGDAQYRRRRAFFICFAMSYLCFAHLSFDDGLSLRVNTRDFPTRFIRSGYPAITGRDDLDLIIFEESSGHSQDPFGGHSQDPFGGHSQDSFGGHSQDSFGGQNESAVAREGDETIPTLDESSLGSLTFHSGRIYDVPFSLHIVEFMRISHFLMALAAGELGRIVARVLELGKRPRRALPLSLVRS